MDRIAELIAKGIENLSADELAELDALCHAESDDRLDADLTDEVLAELADLANTLDAVKAENEARVAAQQDRETQRAALADRIRGVAEPIEGEDAPPEVDADGNPIVAEEAPAEAEVEGEAPADEPAEELVPIAASATTQTETPPVISRVAARRPAHLAPRVSTRQAAMVASANVPGVTAGRRIDTTEAIGAAFSAAANAVRTARGDMKMPVLTLSADIPDALMLGRDPELNEERINKRVGPDALVASGGICAPVPFRYDLPTWGETMRPVRDALARFGAQRGGVRTVVPPTILDNGIGDGVGTWTEATDLLATPGGTEYVKVCTTVPCDDTEVVTKVFAITQCVKVGNFRDRWHPEGIRAHMDLTAVWGARFAESLMLQGIDAGSKNVTSGTLLGSKDVFTVLKRLFMEIRYRHRIGRGQRFRVIGFEWVRDNIITDLIRTGPGDGTLEERLVMAESRLDAFFAAQGASVTWSPDFQNGIALGSPGGPPAGVQGEGPIIGYPDVARFYVFLEGSWLFLDGGSLDLGVIRDSSLVATNDFMMFSETFENVHYHGLPGESYVVDIDVCASGGWASAIDIDPCTSGS